MNRQQRFHLVVLSFISMYRRNINQKLKDDQHLFGKTEDIYLFFHTN